MSCNDLPVSENLCLFCEQEFLVNIDPGVDLPILDNFKELFDLTLQDPKEVDVSVKALPSEIISLTDSEEAFDLTKGDLVCNIHDYVNCKICPLSPQSLNRFFESCETSYTPLNKKSKVEQLNELTCENSLESYDLFLDYINGNTHLLTPRSPNTILDSSEILIPPQKKII